MSDGLPNFSNKLILRITLARLADVFDACEKLPQPEKEVACEEIVRRVRALTPNPIGEPDPSAQSFIDRCRELAACAPNEKVGKALLMIASVCEAAVDLPASPSKADA